MKIIVECSNCGNRIEVDPITIGKVAFFRHELENAKFLIETDINKELLEDEVRDADEVDATLKEIEVRCGKCSDFIRLDFQ